MNIIFATREEAEELQKKYTVLELDSFRFLDNPDVVISWCVLDTASVTLKDLSQISQFVDLHNNMMRNYRLRNWKYCEDALEHLVGKWRGEVDSFYAIMNQRLQQYRVQAPDLNWDGSIEKSN